MKLDQSGELFWDTSSPPKLLIECMGICVLSVAYGSDLRGSDAYLHIVGQFSGFKKEQFIQGTFPGISFV